MKKTDLKDSFESSSSSHSFSRSQWTPLPIDSSLVEIQTALNKNNTVLLRSPPGTGKTTRVPVALSEIFPGKILILEPRRIAAISSAQRIADENFNTDTQARWSVGNEVGHWIRFEKNFTKSSRIVFLTEALFARWLQEDPKLEDVSAVILDEFHERSLHTDLAFGLIRELQQLERPDLKLLIMSATIETEKLKDQFQKVIDISTPTFHLEIEYENKNQTLTTGPELTKRVVQAIAKTLRQNSAEGLTSQQEAGHLLVFCLANEISTKSDANLNLNFRITLRIRQVKYSYCHFMEV